jgi:hypothetical protein
LVEVVLMIALPSRMCHEGVSLGQVHVLLVLEQRWCPRGAWLSLVAAHPARSLEHFSR